MGVSVSVSGLGFVVGVVGVEGGKRIEGGVRKGLIFSFKCRVVMGSYGRLWKGGGIYILEF